MDVYTETDMPPYNPMLTTYYAAGKLSYDSMFPFGTLKDIEETGIEPEYIFEGVGQILEEIFGKTNGGIL